MRHFLLFLIVLSMVAFGAGCAETGVCPAGEVRVDGDCVGPSKIIPVTCQVQVEFPPPMDPIAAAFELSWELTVSPTPIPSGELFTATLGGVAVIDELILDIAQTVVQGGAAEGNLVDLNATVHVRSGATGDDVPLTIEPIPYECFFNRVECDPDNDDLSGVPGRRSNTDCQPEETTNPCGRFALVPTSTDCAPGGVCDGKNKTGPGSQCQLNDFCVTGDLRFPLETEPGQYIAGSEGNVLFGWADEPVEEAPPFESPTGPIGLRIGVGPLLAAFECTLDAVDSALISFPIETP